MGKTLSDGLRAAGIEFNQETLEKFDLYRRLIEEWNQRVNLTSIKGEEDIDRFHFLDSATIWKDVRDAKSLADIGTGAGFPGIPMKILGMKGKVYLFDSLMKRVRFLETAVDMLGLSDCRPVHMRAEDAGRGSYREKFDAVTARAVAGLPVLSEYCIPLLKKGGTFIAMKGKRDLDEISGAKRAIGLLGGRIEEIRGVSLFGSDAERTLVLIKKTGDTPAVYPRKAGTPAKRPL